MVMTKQESGVKRARKATGTVDGKLVTTEYTITAEPPLVPEKAELGWTERISHGSVSTWKSHPAKGKADEHANHTLAVFALIEAYGAAGGEIAAVKPPEEKPAKPAKTKAVGKTSRARPAKEPAAGGAAVLDAQQAGKAARSGTTTRGRRKPSAKATAAAAAPDPTPGGRTEATASGETAPSAVTADEPPRLPETELIPAGAEHAAALDDDISYPSAAVAAQHDPEAQGAVQALEDAADAAAVAASRAEAGPGVPHEQAMAESAALEDAVLTDPEAAAAVGAPGGWGEGYPEGKHRAPAAANPFEPDPDDPFAGSGFVR